MKLEVLVIAGLLAASSYAAPSPAPDAADDAGYFGNVRQTAKESAYAATKALSAAGPKGTSSARATASAKSELLDDTVIGDLPFPWDLILGSPDKEGSAFDLGKICNSLQTFKWDDFQIFSKEFEGLKKKFTAKDVKKLVTTTVGNAVDGVVKGVANFYQQAGIPPNSRLVKALDSLADHLLKIWIPSEQYIEKWLQGKTDNTKLGIGWDKGSGKPSSGSKKSGSGGWWSGGFGGDGSGKKGAPEPKSKSFTSTITGFFSDLISLIPGFGKKEGGSGPESPPHSNPAQKPGVGRHGAGKGQGKPSLGKPEPNKGGKSSRTGYMTVEVPLYDGADSGDAYSGFPGGYDLGYTDSGSNGYGAVRLGSTGSSASAASAASAANGASTGSAASAASAAEAANAASSASAAADAASVNSGYLGGTGGSQSNADASADSSGAGSLYPGSAGSSGSDANGYDSTSVGTSGVGADSYNFGGVGINIPGGTGSSVTGVGYSSGSGIGSSIFSYPVNAGGSGDDGNSAFGSAGSSGSGSGSGNSYSGSSGGGYDAISGNTGNYGASGLYGAGDTTNSGGISFDASIGGAGSGTSDGYSGNIGSDSYTGSSASSGSTASSSSDGGGYTNDAGSSAGASSDVYNGDSGAASSSANAAGSASAGNSDFGTNAGQAIGGFSGINGGWSGGRTQPFSSGAILPGRQVRYPGVRRRPGRRGYAGALSGAASNANGGGYSVYNPAAGGLSGTSTGYSGYPGLGGRVDGGYTQAGANSGASSGVYFGSPGGNGRRAW